MRYGDRDRNLQIQRSRRERAVPRQPYLPVPVASSRNVTEKSALGVIRRQRYFRQSTVVSQRNLGRSVDQLACHDASPLLTPRCNVRRCARLNRFGSVSCSRPRNATALASGSSCNQPSTWHHTPSQGSFRVRKLCGALARSLRSACSCSSRHRSGSLARKRSKLSPRGVGLS